MFKNKALEQLKSKGRIVFKSPFLKNLTLSEAIEFTQICHPRKFKAGEYIYHQNDPGNGMYFLEEGIIELIVENPIDNTEEAVFTLEPPAVFGNLSLSYEMRRMSSARAKIDCNVLGFFNSDLQMVQKRYPQIAIKLMDEINYSIAQQYTKTLKALMALSSESDTYQIQFDELKKVDD